MTKRELLAAGVDLMHRFCALNAIEPPQIEVSRDPTNYRVCAYYRDGFIHIWPAACAFIGTAGRAWSFPGHTVDRTPYGVVNHELGHHLDVAHGACPGLHGLWRWRAETAEKPISGYCPNDNEWFAEMFRLFVTNPDLLRLFRPKTHARMVALWRPIEVRSWDAVLARAPRQLDLIRRRITAMPVERPAPLLEVRP